MKLLLDTHIWIWAYERPEKLTRAVRRQLEDPKNELYLSPISVWEAHLLANRGRLKLRQAFAGWLERALSQSPIREAPFNFAVAAQASQISLPQNDLGDLLLAATCIVFNLVLVTADLQLIECNWLKTISCE